MKILILIAISLIISIALLLPACHAPAKTTTSTGPIPVPVIVVSVMGPLPPINPGGPVIEVTLKNVSSENVISLTAGLGITRVGPSGPFIYNFNVSSTAPLQPGKTVSTRQGLIAGGFDSATYYPLSINGTLQGGGIFSYTEQVKITAPAQ